MTPVHLSGLDIARLWLPGEAAILTVEGREVAGSAAVLQVCIPTCMSLVALLLMYQTLTTAVSG